MSALEILILLPCLIPAVFHVGVALGALATRRIRRLPLIWRIASLPTFCAVAPIHVHSLIAAIKKTKKAMHSTVSETGNNLHSRSPVLSVGG